jgi:hypothetical protein
LYQAAPRHAYPVTLAVRVRGTNASSFIPRLRDISARLDPNLQLRNVGTLDAVLREEQDMMRLVAIGLGAVTASVVVLSAAGIYALMSLTDGELMKGNGAVVLPMVAALMIVVGLLAALGPARRGLRIHPIEALREQ